MKNIEIGSIVKLKSSGPTMTVDKYKWDGANGVTDKERVECSWFKDNVRFKEYFNIKTIEIVENSKD